MFNIIMKILIIILIVVFIYVLLWLLLKNQKPEISQLNIDENDPLWKVLGLWIKNRF